MSKKRPIKVEEEINPDLEMYEVLVLDRSGSMEPVKGVTIEQVNKYIADAQAAADKDKIKTFYSLILFDNEITPLYNFTPVAEIPALTNVTYVPRGSTSLNDAIGHAIEELKTKLKGRENHKDVDVTITIFTDGYENSSNKYPGKGNKELFSYIEEIKSAYGWTVAFVGAGTPEEIARTASTYGISAGSTLSYNLTGDSAHDGQAISASFSTMESARGLKRSLFSSGIKGCSATYFSDTSTSTGDIPHQQVSVTSSTGQIRKAADIITRAHAVKLPTADPTTGVWPAPGE